MGREKRTCQGKQHFSHPHLLKLIVNPSETLTCNACEQPNITTTFYGCNTCQYFLHENCLNAPRFLDHSSHPSHHLTLLPTPTYSNRSYTCKACGSAGNGCSFSCACCEFDVHMHCALLPQTVVLSILIDKHQHELELCFGSPYEDKDTLFACDICNIIMDSDESLYYCADCDFGSHLHCASPDADVLPSSHQRRNPNPKYQIPNVNSSVEMINSVSDAHERLIAAQIESQIARRGRQAILDSIDGPSPRRYYY
ncbi:uncharacterized protein LOC125841208 [Solanum stenotomum]|uniref:uncharacterized protein LOC125841208 n=1 Tax=Solanum stenotomum TaxID=172797 RepID=UPI0020D0B3BD|nr:uncharacterized protein LOC125841208 [Solanum stenotomum]